MLTVLKQTLQENLPHKLELTAPKRKKLIMTAPRIATDLNITLVFSVTQNEQDYYAMEKPDGTFADTLVFAPRGSSEDKVIDALYGGALVAA